MFIKIVFVLCCSKLLKMPKKGSKNGHFWGPKIPENHENSPSENKKTMLYKIYNNMMLIKFLITNVFIKLKTQYKYNKNKNRFL